MDAAGPKPTAANLGTLLSVEDLFYNMPLRKKVPPCPPALPLLVLCAQLCPSASYAAQPIPLLKWPQCPS
jgi:hypothetical protein